MAVAVEVDQRDSEAEDAASGGDQPEPARRVPIDAARLTLSPERDRGTIVEVGDGQVAETVAVQVTQGDPHPRDDLAATVAGDARLLADLFESQVPLVGEQPAGRGVVRDVDIGSIDPPSTRR